MSTSSAAPGALVADDNVAPVWQTLGTESKEIIMTRMPAKIKLLTELCSTNPAFARNAIAAEPDLPRSVPHRSAANASTGTAGSAPGNHDAGEPASKKRKTGVDSLQSVQASVPVHQRCTEMMAILKPELLNLIEMVNTIRLWIQLNVPSIEFGANDGVAIQEEIVGELSRAEDSSFAVIDGMAKYHVMRAKLINKMLKHPQIDDFRQSVVALDEKESIKLRLIAYDLRSSYATLCDLIRKNWIKLTNPRSSTAVHTMY